MSGLSFLRQKCQQVVYLVYASILLSNIGCGSRSAGAGPEQAQNDGVASEQPVAVVKDKKTEEQIQKPSIKAAYASYFPVGVAVGPSHLASVDHIIKDHFDHLTAENDMKFGPIHPGPETWNYKNADAIADFARKHGMKMTGHTLLWHRMHPEWVFADLKAGDKGSIEKLKGRLKTHIYTVVERYNDVVDNWDVVNEAISDADDKTYRDGGEGSRWYEIYGDETYVHDAFLYAKEALEKTGGGVEGKLYYNDYNVTKKLEKVMGLVNGLRDEKGLPVAGVGIQAHWNLEWPAIDDIQKAIDRIAGAGFKVKISELDISIYTNDDWANEAWEPEKPFSDEIKEAQAKRYKSLFELFRKNKEVITSVTLWGVSDDATWLDNFPAKNRNNHPLLFNDAHQAKKSVSAILDF